VQSKVASFNPVDPRVVINPSIVSIQRKPLAMIRRCLGYPCRDVFCQRVHPAPELSTRSINDPVLTGRQRAVIRDGDTATPIPVDAVAREGHELADAENGQGRKL
jgi:hypothetical protein